MAPAIANFYEHDELIVLIRLLSLKIIAISFIVVPRTKLTVEMNFKLLALTNLVGIFIGGAVAISMALYGFGAISVVFQQLISSIVTVILLLCIYRWKPVFSFSKKSFFELFDFGYKLLLSGVIDTIYNNIYTLIIGKKFSSGELGLFNQGYTLSSVPAITMTTVIQKVTYPLLSSLQKKELELDRVFLLVLKVSTLVVAPLMLIICTIAEPLVLIILGDSWIKSATYITILSMGMAIFPAHAINLNMLQVKGRSELFLKLEVIKKTIATIILLVTLPFGIVPMCIGIVVSSYLSLIVNTYYTGKLTSISQIEQLRELVSIISIAFISFLVSFYVTNGIDGELVSIFLGATSYLVTYT
ncbi:lipopolysaccharide biosynthesis protein, partial [Salinivibrio sp. IB643]|uniref:lipopolysaccharide biosynthesis protein n=1 Tax=Salinivibrio sp. IB643 TaxID=1909445 RepID=UPI000988CB33